MIKLVILDIDGVMTDGTKTVNTFGAVLSKRFNDKDWTAIKQLKAAGVSVCFLSGDSWNNLIAENRRIDFYLSMSDEGKLNKKEWLPKLLEIYNVTKEETVYVGDDCFDLEIIDELTYTFCPYDSPTSVKNGVLAVLNRKGGEGVVVELLEYLLNKNLINSFTYDSVVEIDSKEKK